VISPGFEQKGIPVLPPAALDVVPYITAYERERVLDPPLVVRRGPQGAFLAYQDELPHDRTHWGVLWVRQALPPKARRGRPRFQDVHALRQRRAMLDMLCQVCGKPAMASDERLLFLMRDVGEPIREGETTASPPVCVPCARISVQACPHLRRGAMAAWVAHAPSWGVSGVLYDPRTVQPVPGDELVDVPYEDPHIRWVLAARQVVELQGVTPVNLEDLEEGPAA